MILFALSSYVRYFRWQNVKNPGAYGFFYNYYACLGDPARVEAWRQVLLHGAHPGQGGEHAQDHPAGSHQG